LPRASFVEQVFLRPTTTLRCCPELTKLYLTAPTDSPADGGHMTLHAMINTLSFIEILMSSFFTKVTASGTLYRRSISLQRNSHPSASYLSHFLFSNHFLAIIYFSTGPQNLLDSESHKKCTTLFWTITLAFWSNCYAFCTSGNRNKYSIVYLTT